MTEEYTHADSITLTSGELKAMQIAAFNEGLDAVLDSMRLMASYLKQGVPAPTDRQVMWQEFVNLLEYEVTHNLYDSYD